MILKRSLNKPPFPTHDTREKILIFDYSAINFFPVERLKVVLVERKTGHCQIGILEGTLS